MQAVEVKRKTPVELFKDPSGGPVGLPITAHMALRRGEHACREAQWFTDHPFRHNREEALHWLYEARKALDEAEQAILFEGNQ